MTTWDILKFTLWSWSQRPLRSSKRMLQGWRNNLRSRRYAGSDLMVEESMAAERSFSTIWHRRATLGEYEPLTHTCRVGYRSDAIVQYWTRHGSCSSMLGCQISSGLRPLPQQWTSKTDYQPEPSRTRLHMRDGLEWSQTSHTFIPSVAKQLPGSMEISERRSIITLTNESLLDTR